MRPAPELPGRRPRRDAARRRRRRRRRRGNAPELPRRGRRRGLELGRGPLEQRRGGRRRGGRRLRRGVDRSADRARGAGCCRAATRGARSPRASTPPSALPGSRGRSRCRRREERADSRSSKISSVSNRRRSVEGRSDVIARLRPPSAFGRTRARRRPVRTAHLSKGHHKANPAFDGLSNFATLPTGLRPTFRPARPGRRRASRRIRFSTSTH